MSDIIKKIDLEIVTGGAPFPPGSPRFVQCPKMWLRIQLHRAWQRYILGPC